MSYQGRLTNSQGQPVADGTRNVRFYIWSAESGGKLLWQEPAVGQPARQVQVTGGVLSVIMGSVVPLPEDAFAGSTWLQIEIDGSMLEPKIQIASVGYAIRSRVAESVTSGSVTGTGIVDGTVQAADLASGAVTNSKIADGSVSNAKVANNTLTSGKIAAGQVVKSINTLKDDVTLVAGDNISITPSGNQLTLSANLDAVAWSIGGNSGTDSSTNWLGTNDAQALDFRVDLDRALRLEPGSTFYDSPNLIGGYTGNYVTAGAFGAAIGGGGGRTMGYPVPLSLPNRVTDYFGTVAGGRNNQSGDNAGTVSDRQFATVGGGESNTASGAHSVVPGGLSNVAMGRFSFAAGRRAKANHDGSFVWSDSTDADWASTAPNQFLIQASGGVGINTDSPAAGVALDAAGVIKSSSGGFRFPDGSTQTKAVSSSGTSGYVPLFSANPNALQNSGIYQLGTGEIGIGTTSPQAGLMVRKEDGDHDIAIWGIGSSAGVYASGSRWGVYGMGPDIGVIGRSNDYGAGIVGVANSTKAYAGLFDGNVRVDGLLSKSGGSFKIDHPLDPENKFLSHSFVESPDMMNVYNGNITTDAGGNAVVTLPGYFMALNRDFRYQLTVIGQFAQAIVSEEIKGNRFSIKTDKPNVKVSWQVTGIRQDTWANANRIVVEEVKSERDKAGAAGASIQSITPADNAGK